MKHVSIGVVFLFAAASAAKSAALSLVALSLKPVAGGSGAGSAACKVALATTSSSAAAITPHTEMQVEPFSNLPQERSGRSPTLQKTEKTACFRQWRDDLRVVRGSFA